MDWSDYEVDGQLSIFDYISDTEVKSDNYYEFSFDKDINEIHYRLINLFAKHRITITNDEWSIWGHATHLGYRMSITIDVSKEQLNDALYQELNEIVEWAKLHKIELSPMTPVFLSEDGIGWMHIFSMFMDRERQKIR